MIMKVKKFSIAGLVGQEQRDSDSEMHGRIKSAMMATILELSVGEHA